MEKWEEALVNASTTIYGTLDRINEAGTQMALVVDEQRKLLGIVTDGDIRRAILKRVDLNQSVDLIMQKKPLTITSKYPYSKIQKLMRERKIFRIPVIDEQGHVEGIKTLSNLDSVKRKENAVVLMAGGLGARLRPMTNYCPKPMLKIGNKPILESILENFIDSGFYRFFISVNYMADVIEEYFGDGSQYGVEIQYLKEKQKMGTAGSLTLLPDREELPIIVMNGDILTKLDFESLLAYHIEDAAEATMAVREYGVQIPYGVIDVQDGQLSSIREKPRETYLVNAGIYVLNTTVLDKIDKEKFTDMPVVFNSVIEEGKRVGVFPIKEYWLDIGKLDDFERAQNEYIDVFKK